MQIHGGKNAFTCCWKLNRLGHWLTESTFKQVWRRLYCHADILQRSQRGGHDWANFVCWLVLSCFLHICSISCKNFFIPLISWFFLCDTNKNQRKLNSVLEFQCIGTDIDWGGDILGHPPSWNAAHCIILKGSLGVSRGRHLLGGISRCRVLSPFIPACRWNSFWLAVLNQIESL